MDLTLPNIQTLDSDVNYGKFVVEPLERGYGVTLGKFPAPRSAGVYTGRGHHLR